MSENEASDEPWRREAAELEAQAVQRAAAEAAWWDARAAKQQDEVLRQNNLMYGGLIGIGIVMVQPFLSTTEPLNLTAKICVVAFAIAIPILAASVVLNSQEMYRKRPAKSMYVLVARMAALGLGFVGVVAGFWHITPIAGIGALVAGGVAISVHSVGYLRVERDDATASGESVPGPDQAIGT